jgi:hypothetical protein
VVTGSFEIHIFVEPLDPPPEAVERFRAACAAGQMKALLLHLDYVGKGFVGVLQSSRYVNGDEATALAAAHHDAEHLRKSGLTVLREKVEAIASDDGVPRSAADAGRSPPDRYFEFHLLIDAKQPPLSETDMLGLRALSAELAAHLGTPVPLSYNALKPSQRFLNLRARGVGLDVAMEPVRALERSLHPDLELKKVIAEYICFDSNRAVDNGWLEPL